MSPDEDAWDVVPDLAVEVVSPTDIAQNLLGKVKEYFQAGVRLVWVVYPVQRCIHVYEAWTRIRVVTESGHPGRRRGLARLTPDPGSPVRPGRGGERKGPVIAPPRIGIHGEFEFPRAGFIMEAESSRAPPNARGGPAPWRTCRAIRRSSIRRSVWRFASRARGRRSRT